MKTKLAFLILIATFATTAHASKTILPDACGDEKVQFDIQTKKDQPAPAAPEEGKAQIVFIETFRQIGHLGTPEARFGMDGAWVGADKGKSYFAISVAPGVHHLCANWSKSADVTSITAEAGKTYYVEANICNCRTGGAMVMGAAAPGQAPPMIVGGARTDASFELHLLTEDEGKYRVKASPVSVSNTH